MLATQGGDPEEIQTAVINCLNDHISTPGIKAEELPQCEAELLLINMRAKSVGETLDLVLTDPEDGERVEAKVSIPAIEIFVDEKFDTLVRLDDECFLQFRLPTMTTAEVIKQEDNEFDKTLNFLMSCLVSIHVGDEVYQRADTPESEMRDFLMELQSQDWNKINNIFFNRLPGLRAVVKGKKRNGVEFQTEVSGLATFL